MRANNIIQILKNIAASDFFLFFVFLALVFVVHVNSSHLVFVVLALCIYGFYLASIIAYSPGCKSFLHGLVSSLKETHIVLIVISFVIFPLYSLFYTPNPAYGAQKIFGLAFGVIPLAFVFSFLVSVATKERLRRLLMMLFSFGTILLVLRFISKEFVYDGKIHFFYWSHVGYGRYIALAAITALLNLLYAKSTVDRIVFFLLYGLFEFGVLISGLRAAFLGVIFFSVGILCVTFVFEKRLSRNLCLAALGLLLLPAEIVLFRPLFPTSIQRCVKSTSTVFTSESRDDSIVKRQNAVATSVAMFFEKPIIGRGFGGFNSYFRKEAHTEIKYPHNLFLEVGAELGLIGLILFCFLIALSLLKAYAFHPNLFYFFAFALWLAQFSGDLPYQKVLFISTGMLLIPKKLFEASKQRLTLLFVCFLLCPLGTGLCAQDRNVLHSRGSYPFYGANPDSMFILPTVKPLSLPGVESLTNMRNEREDSTRSWLMRKLLDEDLINYQGHDYWIRLNIFPDFVLGKDHSKLTWLNTRGAAVSGGVSDHILFNSSLYENQARFPDYLTNRIENSGVILGQGLYDKSKGIDWSYSSASLSYTANSHMNFLLAFDRQFIGDGYRSMLLSDVSMNYPFFRWTFSLDPVTYTCTWAQLSDMDSPKLSNLAGYQKKWAVFHYLDLSLSSRCNIGFFDAILWANSDSNGYYGFDFSYANPIIFLRSVDLSNDSPGNAMLGVNGKYFIAPQTLLYGQFLIDEFTEKEMFSSKGYWGNKYAYQIGLRGKMPTNALNLFYLCELNMARPYTYSESAPIISYSNANSPLAHPLGANFREGVAHLDAVFGRYVFSVHCNYAVYGKDSSTISYGGNPLNSYENRNANYGISLFQGVRTTLSVVDARVQYILNSRSYLRVEAGVISRIESSALNDENSLWFFVGLRSSLRTIYLDY